MDESERQAQGAEGVWQARSKEESGDRKERAWLESVGLIACVTHLLHLLCLDEQLIMRVIGQPCLDWSRFGDEMQGVVNPAIVSVIFPRDRGD